MLSDFDLLIGSTVVEGELIKVPESLEEFERISESKSNKINYRLPLNFTPRLIQKNISRQPKV